MIDTHAHLNDPVFDSDRQEVLQRAHLKGIETIIDVSENLESAEDSLKLFEKETNVWSTVGFHPHLAAVANDADLQKFRSLLQNRKVIAVGEIGLDYYYEHQPRHIQLHVFDQMLGLALEADLPVIIHSRNSDEDLIEILSRKRSQGLRGLIHCYTGGLKTALHLLEMGFFISFSGIITFKNAEFLREVVREMPLDRILVETDAPYLTPVPMRGQRNEPAYVLYTVEAVAKIKGLSLEKLQKLVLDNARMLFPKMISKSGIQN
jgi:TatD DNase family protein